MVMVVMVVWVVVVTGNETMEMQSHICPRLVHVYEVRGSRRGLREAGISWNFRCRQKF
jgi:hypothetical protein